MGDLQGNLLAPNDNKPNIEVVMIKFCFKLMSVFWIVSPVIYIGLRLTKTFDFGVDWLVFSILSFISWISMFFTYKTWDE